MTPLDRLKSLRNPDEHYIGMGGYEYLRYGDIQVSATSKFYFLKKGNDSSWIQAPHIIFYWGYRLLNPFTVFLNPAKRCIRKIDTMSKEITSE